MNNPVRQHTVPEFYLNLFSASDGKVSVIDRQTCKTWRQSADRVSIEKHIYTLPKVFGIDPYALERAFGSIEGLAAPVLKQLANQLSLHGVDRKTVATFMAIQLKRSTHLNDHHKRFAEYVSKPDVIVTYLEENREQLSRKFPENEIDILIDDYKSGRKRFEINTSEMMLHAQRRNEDYRREFMDMYWRLEISKDGSFLTSDNPVYARNRENPLTPGTVGITRQDLNVEVCFPICPKAVIVLSWDPHRIAESTSLTSKEFKRLIVGLSSAQIGNCTEKP